jgi:hypothetical protein
MMHRQLCLDREGKSRKKEQAAAGETPTVERREKSGVHGLTVSAQWENAMPKNRPGLYYNRLAARTMNRLA